MSGTYKGIGVSEGIGIGKVLLIQTRPLVYDKKQIEDTVGEIRRLRDAFERYAADIREKTERVRNALGTGEAEIIASRLQMLSDPYVKDGMEQLIAGGTCAESAVETVCGMFETAFLSSSDEQTVQRAADVRDLRDGILRTLLAIPEPDIAGAEKGTILVAEEITPSMTGEIRRENIAGLVAQSGGYTSHAAILARAMGIPAVMSVPGITNLVKDGDAMAADGSSGVVLVNPTEEERLAFHRKREDGIMRRRVLDAYRGRPTETADGIRVKLLANIGEPGEAEIAVENDAEGVGLFRTEFLYMRRSHLPDEDRQFEAYKLAALRMGGRPLVIRTLDVGGDKEIPYLKLPREENPFLGYRAIRFCLENPDVFKPQLRAILRASAYGDIRILLPFIADIGEVRAAKYVLAEVKEELRRKGIPFRDPISTGIMTETAASVAIADLLAKETDFFSIGTNDLSQYMMAADRGNEKTAALCTHYQPAVLRAVRHLIRTGKNAGISVAMCGEAAADMLLHPLLISWGLDEYSVSPGAVLGVRRNLSLWSREEADAVAQTAMELTTAAEVEACLRSSRKE
ncbi:MAG: phosphoenolpyruvate--protein phosphotransferase [Fusobacteriaceae bacterium]|jgi:phosphotransferase system enzyme I (PtsI)|nr:phosphoenolpyruvate--protein phosphotransferase [Fusobacteriaceae bacterium]